jgi:hypothetical protein
MTRELVNELWAKPNTTENISLSAFGGKGTNPTTGLYCSYTIATPLQCKFNRDISNLPHLKGLKLAHPVQDGNFNIDLLIGADFYWDIVQDNIIRGEAGPTAVIFCPVLLRPVGCRIK